MKSKPSKSKFSNSMPLYRVFISGEQFDTHASNPQAAISKAAYRLAALRGVGVGLIQWKLKNREIDAEAEKIN